MKVALQVELWRHYIPGRAVLGEQVQTRDRIVRPPQVDTHQPGKDHADDHGDQAQAVVLFADYFVIQAKNVLADKRRWRPMVCDRVC
jgi:hypothetical protein